MPRKYYLVGEVSDLRPSDMSQAEYPCKITLDPKAKDEQGKLKFPAQLLQETLEDQGFYIIGVDEAGRGPVAGPVTAGACLLPTKRDASEGRDSLLLDLDDSKKLTEKNRADLYPQVQDVSIAYGIAEASPQEIDELNILNATFLAMRQAIQQVLQKMEDLQLPKKPVLLLVDGNQNIRELESKAWVLSQIPIIKGDGWLSSISAASILAKYHRDRKMDQMSELYPEYDLAQNKGYPSPKHIEAIRQHGRSEIHRQSFHIKAIDEIDLFS